MTVLHVIAGIAPRMGGPAVNLIGLARALQRIGVESTIFSTDMTRPAANPARHDRLDRDELPTDLDIRLFAARSPMRLAYSPSLGRALRRSVGQFDVVHVHGLYLFPQHAAYRSTRCAQKPLVLSPCGALDPYLRSRSRISKAIVDALWQRRMLDTASIIHFKTDEERRLTDDLRLRAPVAVVPNGLEAVAFAPLPDVQVARRELGLGPGPVVLTLGRISHKKGLDVLVKSFAQVLRKHPTAELVIAGPDDEGLLPFLRALATSLGIQEAVHFPGLLLGAAKAGALSATDVWVLPSRTENFAIAVAEALAAGRATVVSPAVNLAPELAHARAAVVAELDPTAFAGAIVELLDAPERRDEYGARARQFARRYEWSRVASEMASLYRNAMERGSGAVLGLGAAA